jgi:hypothetical protein
MLRGKMFLIIKKKMFLFCCIFREIWFELVDVSKRKKKPILTFTRKHKKKSPLRNFNFTGKHKERIKKYFNSKNERISKKLLSGMEIIFFFYVFFYFFLIEIIFIF